MPNGGQRRGLSYNDPGHQPRPLNAGSRVPRGPRNCWRGQSLQVTLTILHLRTVASESSRLRKGRLWKERPRRRGALGEEGLSPGARESCLVTGSSENKAKGHGEGAKRQAWWQVGQEHLGGKNKRQKGTSCSLACPPPQGHAVPSLHCCYL